MLGGGIFLKDSCRLQGGQNFPNLINVIHFKMATLRASPEVAAHGYDLVLVRKIVQIPHCCAIGWDEPHSVLEACVQSVACSVHAVANWRQGSNCAGETGRNFCSWLFVERDGNFSTLSFDSLRFWI